MTIKCIFCDHIATDLASLKEHSATCAEHPAVISLKDAIDHGAKAYECLEIVRRENCDLSKKIAAIREAIA